MHVSLGRKFLKTGRLTAENTGRTGSGPVEKYQNKHPHCLIRTDLSHLSLLFLQGSQFIAFRVRFAGLPSSWVSLEGEPGLGRASCFVGAVLVIAGRDVFRCFEARSSDIVRGGGQSRGHRGSGGLETYRQGRGGIGSTTHGIQRR